MFLTDIQIIQGVWHELDTIVCVPRTERDYRRLSVLWDNLTTLIGESENHPLTSLMEIVEVLIEKYELDRESTEREAVYRFCLLMIAQAHIEAESENTAVTS